MHWFSLSPVLWLLLLLLLLLLLRLFRNYRSAARDRMIIRARIIY